VCNLYSITTNQAAIAALFRVVNRYVGNLAPLPLSFAIIYPFTTTCALPFESALMTEGAEKATQTPQRYVK
jgi:hypothetical protein